MVIGINASALTHPRPTGVERYSEYIIRALLQRGSIHQFKLYTPHTLSEEFRSEQVLLKSPRFWTQVRLPIELYWHKPDVFFQPSYMLPPLCPVPSVVTIHDLAWLKFPHAYTKDQLASQRLMVSRIKKQHSKVIVPSQSAKADCVELLQLPEEQIHIIPEALISLPEPTEQDLAKLKIYKDKHVVLSLGRLEERKNTKTLVRAFEVLVGSHKNQAFPAGLKWQAHTRSVRREDNNPLVLVLIGHPGTGAEDVYDAIREARSAGAEIVHLPAVTDHEIAAWFSVAKAFVYPSLYEGFGLPILQAFAANVPVVTTHISSIPEVAGDAAMYIKDPHDENELAVAMNAVINNQDKTKLLIAKGQEQLKKFSWTKAADQTLAVLTEAATPKNSP